MVNLLVVSSDIPFGELIRQKLEEMGRFRVCVARDKSAAISFVKKENCPLAFLDTCLTEKDLLEIGLRIRQVNPGIRFILFTEAGWHTAFEELAPEDYLSKPLYLPDLVHMMENYFPTLRPPGDTSVSGNTESAPPWLSDFNRAAQHLTRLTLESSAQAALITRNDQLWAYAGQLPQSATGELTDTVSHYWDRQKENDLVRFIHLASTGAEHMLYATRLASNMVLALIFDAETPFGTIHTQANQLVHSLSTSPAEKQRAVEDADDEAPVAPISAILSDIPSPNPVMDAQAVRSQYKRESTQAIPAASLHFGRESSLAEQVDPLPSTEETEFSVDMEETVQSPAVTRKSVFRRNLAPMDDMGATRPNANSEGARKIVLEPVSPSVYNLDYACMLVPRFPHHHLIGDLSEQLADWVYQNCIAYAWRLEYISVRPDYLLWIANVPPSTSPAYLMRIMRQRTSVNIFDEFPRIKKENPSGDFWAPGYLIMGGSQPPPVHLIKDFIAQTRQRQGISQQLR
jgi:REP element-mobilizing transposase RayT/CheY-like chemotaxis protein